MSFTLHSLPDSFSHYLHLGHIHAHLETSGKIEELSLILRGVCFEALRGSSIDPSQLLEILKTIIGQLLDKAMVEASPMTAGVDRGGGALSLGELSSECVTPGGKIFPFFPSMKGELFPAIGCQSPSEKLQSYLESKGINRKKSQKSTELYGDLEAGNAYDLGAKGKGKVSQNRDRSHLYKGRIEERLSERHLPSLEKYSHSYVNYRVPSIPTQRKAVSSRQAASSTHKPYKASQGVEGLRRPPGVIGRRENGSSPVNRLR